jgi:hypothetical protein
VKLLASRDQKTAVTGPEILLKSLHHKSQTEYLKVLLFYAKKEGVFPCGELILLLKDSQQGKFMARVEVVLGLK